MRLFELKYTVIRLFLGFCFIHPGMTQHFNFQIDHLSINEGLSQNLIFDISQDKYGFMWFGTNDGLNRYDGYSFKIYQYNSENTTSFKSNKMEIIHNDRNGNLWVVADGLLYQYNSDSDLFEEIDLDIGQSDLTKIKITTLAEDMEGDLYLAMENVGINKLCLHVDNKHYNNPENYVEKNVNGNNFALEHLQNINQINTMMVDSDQNLWIGSDLGLYILDLNNNHFEDYSFFDFETLSNGYGKNVPVTSIYEDPNQEIWIGTWNGISKLIKGKSTDYLFSFYPHSKEFPKKYMGQIRDMLQVQPGELWMGTVEGLAIFDMNHNTFKYITSDYKAPNGISSNNVVSLFQDQSGVVWLGTGGRGINKINLRTGRLNHYLGKSDFAINHSIYALGTDSKNRIWFGSNQYGLHVFDPGKDELTDWKIPESNISFYDLLIDSEDRIWIAMDNRVLRIDATTNNIDSFKISTFNNEPVLDMRLEEDEDNNLLLVTSNGISKFNERTESFTFLSFPDLNLGSFNSVLVENDRKFWVGNEKGLYHIDLDNPSFTLFNKESNSKDGLHFDNVKVLSFDRSDASIIWMGTAGGGLIQFDQNSKSFTSFTIDNGLSSNYIYGILQNDNNELWLSTNNGLSRFDIEHKIFRNYSINDGLQSNEFNTMSYHQDKKGLMYFGGLNGINVFDPNQITTNPYVPDIILSDFHLFYKSYQDLGKNSPLNSSILNLNQIDLDYDQNSIAFIFSSTDYSNPVKNQFMYTLENFDEDWVDIGNVNRAVYTNIPPGDYIFKVRGSNSDIIWNQSETSIPISINPPFWKTWLAFILYFLLIVITAMMFYNYYRSKKRLTKNLKIEKDKRSELRELDRLKSNFFQGISHEFRTPLTMILGPLDDMILKEQSSKQRSALSRIKKNANYILRLINEVLDISKLEESKVTLNKRADDIVRFTSIITDSFKFKAEEKGISMKFNKSEKLIIDFDHDSVLKIIQNLLDNAIKFTPEGGQIIIDIKVQSGFTPTSYEGSEKNWVMISIQDTGIGIPQNHLENIFNRYTKLQDDGIQEGLGIGLSFVKELVKQNGGTINVSSNLGKGSVFTIHLPVEHETVVSRFGVLEESLAQFSENKVIEQRLYYKQSQDNKSKLKNGNNRDKDVILIVEDNIDLVNYMVDILHEQYDIYFCFNGNEGYRQALNLIPDLIITDLMMPEMNGIQLSKKLKSNNETSHIPIILLTARSDKKSKIKGFDMGVDDYITKPFDNEELISRIGNLITKRDNLKAHYLSTLFSETTNSDYLSVDENFIIKVRHIIEANIEDDSFGVEILANEMAISPTHLYRKLKALMGLSTIELLQSIRLEKAKNLVENNVGNISEIAYMTGFRNPAYFSSCFKKRFGKSPKEFSKAVIK